MHYDALTGCKHVMKKFESALDGFEMDGKFTTRIHCLWCMCVCACVCLSKNYDFNLLCYVGTAKKNMKKAHSKRIVLTVRSLGLWTADRWRTVFGWCCWTGDVDWHLLRNARQIIRFLNVRLYEPMRFKWKWISVGSQHKPTQLTSTLTIWCMWWEWFPPSKFSCVESCCCCCCAPASESHPRKIGKKKKKSRFTQSVPSE